MNAAGAQHHGLPCLMWHRSPVGSIAAACLLPTLVAMVAIGLLAPVRLAARAALAAVLHFLPGPALIQICMLILVSAAALASLGALAGFLKMDLPDGPRHPR
jgi:hypothetical protein